MAAISQHVAPLRAQIVDVVSTSTGQIRHLEAGRARRDQTEHGVGSLLIVGHDTSQAHSSSSTRGSSTTPDDGSHIYRIVRPRCRTESSWLRAGRVWACKRPLQSVHAAAELVCRGRDVVLVLVHEYCCCGTCYTTLVCEEKGE